MAIGSIIPFAGSTIPEDYLVCDGSAVSRVTYSALFEVIGTTYGAGDGSSTFNLPNLSGKVPLGCSLSHVIGSSGGEEEHTLLSGELAAHVHEIPSHGHANTLTFTTPNMTHNITQPAFTYVKLSGSRGRGSGTKVRRYYGTTTADMTRTTDLAIENHANADCTMGGGILDCAALTTDIVGNGNAHNNMMPYLALVYIIQTIPDTPPVPPVPSMLVFNGCMPVGPSGCYLAGRK